MKILIFPGYSIGGLAVGESKKEMYDVLNFMKDILPANKPRYLMGVGSPDDLVVGSMMGVDMFDCDSSYKNCSSWNSFDA